jgi:hypothetical protein
METRVRQRHTWYAVVAQDADEVRRDLPARLAVVFAAITAALLAAVAFAPSLLSLLAVFVIYSAAISATLFVEALRDRRSRLTTASVTPMPVEDVEHLTTDAEEYRRAA